MPTFTNASKDAEELRETVRGLARATRSIDDPTEIYPVLGAVSSALASMAQSLHQIGDFHDGPARKAAWLARSSSIAPDTVVNGATGGGPEISFAGRWRRTST